MGPPPCTSAPHTAVLPLPRFPGWDGANASHSFAGPEPGNEDSWKTGGPDMGMLSPPTKVGGTEDIPAEAEMGREKILEPQVSFLAKGVFLFVQSLPERAFTKTQV